jgi:hypothetical protein
MMTFLNKQQVMMMKKEGQEIDWESVDGHFEVNLVLFMWKVTENLNETSSLETSLQAAIKRIELKKVKY